ncbi:MAG: chromosome partitioning protein ParB, partial [Clostridia bacterium]|nr:chromosome partitioning protein ParB [Clostridia bacterium]
DEGKIALTPAEKLSFLKEEEQRALVELIQDYEATPSLSQAVKMKEMSAMQLLDADMMFEVMSRPKPNQKETLKLDLEALRDFFPDSTPKDMESAILRILTEWQKREQSKVQSRNSWDRDGR